MEKTFKRRVAHVALMAICVLVLACICILRVVPFTGKVREGLCHMVRRFNFFLRAHDLT